MAVMLLLLLLSQVLAGATGGSKPDDPPGQTMVKCPSQILPSGVENDLACKWWQAYYSVILKHHNPTTFLTDRAKVSDDLTTCVGTNQGNGWHYFYGYDTFEAGGSATSTIRTCTESIRKGDKILVPAYTTLQGGCAGCTCVPEKQQHVVPTGGDKTVNNDPSFPWTLKSGQLCSFEQSYALAVELMNQKLGAITAQVIVNNRVYPADATNGRAGQPNPETNLILTHRKTCPISDLFKDGLGDNAAAGGWFSVVDTANLPLGENEVKILVDFGARSTFKFDVTYKFNVVAAPPAKKATLLKEKNN